MWKSVAQLDRQTNEYIKQRFPFACWVIKATDTYSKYGIISAFAQQAQLRECASVLSYTYSTCLVVLSV